MVVSRQTAERVWHGHGPAMHLLSCAFLGDSSRADLAGTQGICDFAGRPEHVRPRDEIAARRELARIVYRLCGEVLCPVRRSHLPRGRPPAWLAPTDVASLLRTGQLDLAGATGQPATASTRSN